MIKKFWQKIKPDVEVVVRVTIVTGVTYLLAHIPANIFSLPADKVALVAAATAGFHAGIREFGKLLSGDKF